MQIDLIRIANSPSCELTCAYCNCVHSKSKTLASARHIKSKNKVFPCNTIYRPDFSSYITAQQGLLSLEVHFLTLNDQKIQPRLELIKNLDIPLIVIIDHIDMNNLVKLKAWDQYVQEYRVIPSRLYTHQLFLNKLPYFVQEKINWALPPQTKEYDPLYNEDEIAQMLDDLNDMKFSSKSFSTHNWMKTFDSSIPLDNHLKRYMTLLTEDESSIHMPHMLTQCVGTLDITQVAIKLTLMESLFVGYFSKIDDDLVNHLQSRDFDLLYISPNEIIELAEIEANQSVSNRKIYFLQNFLIRKDLWCDYVNSTNSIDEYSWSKFIEKNNLITKEIHLKKFKNNRMQKWQVDFQNYFYANPNKEDYQSLFLNFDNTHWSRTAFFYIYHFFYTLLDFIPSQSKARWENITRKTQLLTQSAAYNINDEIFDTSKNLKRSYFNLKYSLHRLYWFLYNKIWMTYGNVWGKYIYGLFFGKYIYGLFIRKYIIGRLCMDLIYGKLIKKVIYWDLLRKTIYGYWIKNIIYGKFLNRFIYNYMLKYLIFGQLLNKFLYGLIVKNLIFGQFLKRFLFSFILQHCLWGEILQKFLYGTLFCRFLYGTLFCRFLYGTLFCRFLYGTIWSSSIGFLSSLNDYPKSIDQLPLQQRVKLKTRFIFKKFGWLALRSIGLR